MGQGAYNRSLGYFVVPGNTKVFKDNNENNTRKGGGMSKGTRANRKSSQWPRCKKNGANKITQYFIITLNIK